MSARPSDNPPADPVLLKTQDSRPKTSSYTVLARRYRSRDFDELLGQEPIARTLRNAVESGRSAHAYLFCGSRGVGKTSMARILAKALNVTPDLSQADEIAAAILRGDDLDVVEIDGASNRGVNEARDLIAGAGLSPARCRNKIYIIDEVHMLTKEAFNTLLKTMEEPPEHVKFILCTTEPTKVPATIQSRCQRFDFRLLPTSLIADHLRSILQDEGVAADDHVVVQVARMGRGSMRDALSLLDRLLAAGDDTLSTELLDQMLGLPDQALAAHLAEAIAAGDSAEALKAGAALLDRGASVDQALDTLAEHFRNLMLIAACGADSELVELSEDARSMAVAQAGRYDAAGLVHMIALCDSAARNARFSEIARAIFDAAIVRLCASEHLADIAALLGRAPTAQRALPKKKEEPVTPATATAPPAVESVLPVAEAPRARPSADPPADGRALWEQVCAHAAGSPSDHARVEHLEYAALDGRTLRLSVSTGDRGLATWLAGQTAALAELVQQATAQRLQIEIEAKPAADAPSSAPSARKFEQAEQLPLVKMAMEIFDADVVEVEGEEEGTEGLRD